MTCEYMNLNKYERRREDVYCKGCYSKGCDHEDMAVHYEAYRAHGKSLRIGICFKNLCVWVR